MDRLPYDIEEGMVQCFGRCFYYKNGMRTFLVRCGVDAALVDRFMQLPKFVWARNVLDELAKTEDGRVVQRKLLASLVNLRKLPDQNVGDQDGGLNALRDLKEMANHLVVIQQVSTDAASMRAQRQDDLAARSSRRKESLAKLHREYCDCIMSADRQAAGYSLERLLCDLFGEFGIESHPSYRTDTQQVDGYFVFESFHYLLEAKWRADMPTEGEIGGFERKIKTKMQSTRGLFVSIPGFREEVANAYSGCGGAILLMNGQSLAHILEGRWDATDALRAMIEAASKRGVAHFPLS